MWYRIIVVLGIVGIVIGLVLYVGKPASSTGRHDDIIATVFWVGEAAGPENDNIANMASAWDGNWVRRFGGIDTPTHRQHGGAWPAGFRPLENPFYFALPYSECTDAGEIKPSAQSIPWYGSGAYPSEKYSILKNHWIRITHGKRVAYAQWQDVGPFESDDFDYVFGSQPPREQRAGIDLSPALANQLRIDGKGIVSWEFVEESAVPAGPWKEIVTRSQVSY